ncbi:helix-turn-helix domain-containing protein [Paeniglutamicibacter sp. MACA_103]|uniref:AraC family transcriptional regulator n=1 Tax=Paeniglutamicibacter sp. MACA_103 TaxID=3377337 RepID=UPI00389374F0
MDTPRGPLLPTGEGTAHVARLNPSAALRELVVHYWLPTWQIPAGASHEQRILSYPGCNLAIEDGIGTLYGPVTRLSTKRLSGSGRAFGVLLRPGTGALLSTIPVPELVDGSVAASNCGLDCAEHIQAALYAEGTTEQQHGAAIKIFEDWLAQRLPDGLDEEGLLLNRICADIESTPGLQRVAQLCERWQIGERSLQRLVRTRMGITPKWLLQRHRLQEAAQLMGRGAGPNLARLAHALGYADQAHFTRDFASVTGMSPGEYVRQVQAGPASN